MQGDRVPPPVSRWGITLTGPNVQRMSGQNIGQVEEPVHEILAEVPALASLVVHYGPTDRATEPMRRERAELVVRDLVTVRQQQAIVLLRR